jgi:hypothetical protein
MLDHLVATLPRDANKPYTNISHAKFVVQTLTQTDRPLDPDA